MIRSFKDRETDSVFQGQPSQWFPRDIQDRARRKLRMLNGAVSLTDLRSPPGNRLEELKGDRAGQYSIRVNDQYRICFVWRDAGAEKVELVDYHD